VIGGRRVLKGRIVALVSVLAIVPASAQDDPRLFFQLEQQLKQQQQQQQQQQSQPLPPTSQEQSRDQLSLASNRQIQEWLVWEGLYAGPLDGQLGLGTISAIKRFQKGIEQPDDGRLSILQRNALKERALKQMHDVGYVMVSDPGSGLRLGVPGAILEIREFGKFGINYFSKSSAIRLSLRAFQHQEEITQIYELYRRALDGSNIEYTTIRPDWFVFAGDLSSRKFYIRFHQRGGVLAGFFAIYNKNNLDFRIPLTMMSLSLQPFTIAAQTAISIGPSDRDILLEFATLLRDSAPAAAPSAEAIPPRRLPDQTAKSEPPPAQPVPDGLSRKERLAKLSGKSLRTLPAFYEYLVEKKDLPGLNSEEPVLRVVFEERVFFDTGLATVRRDAEQVLDVIADALRKEPAEAALFVVGHTDSRGDEAYNLDLSVRRAESVAQALAKRKTGNAKVWKVGFGKAVPLRPNDTPSNMAVNRRVEFILSSKVEAVAAWLSKQPEFLCTGENAKVLEVCKTDTVVASSFTASSVTEIPMTSGGREAITQIEIALKPLQVEIQIAPPPVIEMKRPRL
jgi:outer membrane protein OmpA-like peptidoglycan-associated protein